MSTFDIVIVAVVIDIALLIIHLYIRYRRGGAPVLVRKDGKELFGKDILREMEKHAEDNPDGWWCTYTIDGEQHRMFVTNWLDALEKLEAKLIEIDGRREDEQV